MSLKLIAALSTACALFAAAAMATPVTVTLSSAYPAGYYFYNYTATDGSSQSQPVAPYPVTVSETGVYSNQSAFAFCFDINNPSYVGQTYTGQLVTRTDQASMEATYLENELNAAGLISASTTLNGHLGDHVSLFHKDRRFHLRRGSGRIVLRGPGQSSRNQRRVDHSRLRDLPHLHSG
jgi:hypothetical protein